MRLPQRHLNIHFLLVLTKNIGSDLKSSGYALNIQLPLHKTLLFFIVLMFSTQILCFSYLLRMQLVDHTNLQRNARASYQFDSKNILIPMLLSSCHAVVCTDVNYTALFIGIVTRANSPGCGCCVCLMFLRRWGNFQT